MRIEARTLTIALAAIMPAACAGFEDQIPQDEVSTISPNTDQEDNADSDDCTRATCSSLNAYCGFPPDGCGGTLSCGTCDEGQICDDSNACVDGECPAFSCETEGAECGRLLDNCNSTEIDCGECDFGLMCENNRCVEDPDAGCAVAVPATWNPTAKHEPGQIHITWQNDTATTATLQWQTSVTNDNSGYVPKAVLWTGAGEKMTYNARLTAEGEAQVYTFLGLQKRVTWTVEIEGLKPDTQYFYRVGTWESADTASCSFSGAELSGVHSFRTGHTKGSDAPIHFIACGDSRQGAKGIKNNVQHFIDIDPDFWLFSGDFTDLGTQGEWDEWWNAIGPALSESPFMPVIGNHELIASVYFGNFALPRYPNAGELSGLQEHVWSFDYGNLHVVGLDSNVTSSKTKQKTWLEADLAAASADEDIDWIIVMVHYPFFSASNHGSTTDLHSWLPVLEQYGVDLTIAGHDHDYERTYPIAAKTVVAEGTGVRHIVAGGFYTPGYGNGSNWFTEYSVHGDLNNYLVIEIEGKTLDLTAFDGNHNTIDRLTLKK